MAGKTLVALYDDFGDAVHAVRALEEAGFQHEDVSLVANNAEHRWGDAEAARHAALQRPGAEASQSAATGAAVGAVAGGGGALLASLGLLAIPGIGPAFAAGPIVALIAGAGVGAAAGGLVGGLAGLGVAEEEAHAFAEAVRRGGALVTARVPSEEAGRALEILEQHHPADIEERAANWRQSGWQRFEKEAEPWTVRSIEAERGRRSGSRSTTGAGFEGTTGSGQIGGGDERDAGSEATSPQTAAALRGGTIYRESETARMSGGPVSTAMSGMAGSPGGLREQEEPLKRHGDMARVRSYDSAGASPGERLDREIDRTAAGDEPKPADDSDRDGDDPLAGRK